MTNVYNDLPKDVKNIVNDISAANKPPLTDGERFKQDRDRANSMGINEDFEQFYQTYIYPNISRSARNGKNQYLIGYYTTDFRAIMKYYGYKQFKRKLKEKNLKVTRNFFGLGDIVIKW